MRSVPTPRSNRVATDPIVPPDPIDPDEPEAALELLHDREYRVRAYRLAADRVLLRGAVRDQQPPGLSVPGDPDPVTIHHMHVDLEVEFPALEIVAARVAFEAHPHEVCPAIIGAYDGLIGLSIARGFTHKVRELFGGPRGCTHTTALLLAMAPVAVQAVWAMRASAVRRGAEPAFAGMDADERKDALRVNVDTCHVWAHDAPMFVAVTTEGAEPVPLPFQRRFQELGLPADGWRRP